MERNVWIIVSAYDDTARKFCFGEGGGGSGSCSTCNQPKETKQTTPRIIYRSVELNKAKCIWHLVSHIYLFQFAMGKRQQTGSICDWQVHLPYLYLRQPCFNVSSVNKSTSRTARTSSPFGGRWETDKAERGPRVVIQVERSEGSEREGWKFSVRFSHIERLGRSPAIKEQHSQSSSTRQGIQQCLEAKTPRLTTDW